MDFWTWVTTTTDINAILNTLGLGALAFLFARDLILTKNQHVRRTADLQEHHARELAEKDRRIDTLDESRREWKEAAAAERLRADEVTATMGTVAASLDGVEHVISALDQSLREANRG